MENQKVGGNANSTLVNRAKKEDESFSTVNYAKEKISYYVSRLIRKGVIRPITDEVKKKLVQKFLQTVLPVEKTIDFVTKPYALSMLETCELFVLKEANTLMGLPTARKERLEELKTKKALRTAGKELGGNLLNIDEAAIALSSVNTASLSSVLLSPLENSIMERTLITLGEEIDEPSFLDKTQSVYLGIKKRTVGLTEEEKLKAATLHTKSQVKEDPKTVTEFLSAVGRSTGKQLVKKNGCLTILGGLSRFISSWSSQQETPSNKQRDRSFEEFQALNF